MNTTSQKKYFCDKCNYNTNDKSNFNRHNLTKRHIMQSKPIIDISIIMEVITKQQKEINEFHWGEKIVDKFYTTKMRDKIAAVLK